jgi:uroporphyrin-III C-methyltransferase
MKEGKVWLVGAGPGEASLITVKGLHCLRHADVVIHDRLINHELILCAPPGCKVVDVGKVKNSHPVPQNEINTLLVKYGLAGKHVVRLKGGDPYVFGRGGEEAECLAQAGVDFEVIPGISSAIGGLAYAGIPVTHRDYASSFHVVTGHMCEGNKPQDWHALAALKGTLVILMGIAHLTEIIRLLLEGGKSPDVAAAIITDASLPNQRVVTATLATLSEKAIQNALRSPALIVIGDVVNLHQALAFGTTHPDIMHAASLETLL